MLPNTEIILLIITISMGLLKIWQKQIYRHFQADTSTHLIQTISIVCLIPVFLFIVPFNFTFSLFNIVLVVIAGTSWYIGSIITNRSIKATDLTLREPIIQTRIIFVILFSAIFLKENISTLEYIGGFLIFSGSIISSFKERNNFRNLKSDGLILSFLAAILISISYTFDKYAMNFIDVLPWAFMMYSVPFIILLPKSKNTWLDIKNQSKKNLLSIFIVFTLMSACYIALLYVFSQTNLSRSFPISQLSSVIIFLGGLYLGERKNLKHRAIGSVVAILGGLLIFLS